MLSHYEFSENALARETKFGSEKNGIFLLKFKQKRLTLIPVFVQTFVWKNNSIMDTSTSRLLLHRAHYIFSLFKCTNLESGNGQIARKKSILYFTLK